jgi:alpha-1,6-mannosyltransferase
MLAAFVPRLARSYGRDPSVAFALAVLNPLVLLHLIAGAHNDALMLGFLVAGLAMAREGRPILGVVLCALGAMIKVPAFIGVVYIGWCWPGTEAPWRSRLRPTITAGLLGAALMTAVSQMVGLGWGWVSALSNPGAVRSWVDPPTAIGLWAARLVTDIGLGRHQELVLSAARTIGLLTAAAIGVRLLWRAKGGEMAMRAMGLTLMAVVFLGPSVQPWYLAWSVVVLATIAEHRLRVIVIGLSCVACFFDLPGARKLVLQFGEANPVLIVAASVALLALLAIPIVMRVRRALRTPEPGTELAARA